MVKVEFDNIGKMVHRDGKYQILNATNGLIKSPKMFINIYKNDYSYKIPALFLI